MAQPSSLSQGTTLGPRQYSVLFESLRELVAILTPDGIIQYANQAFTRVLGYCSDELQGVPLLSLVHGNDAAGVCQRSGELRTNPEKQTTGRCRLRAKDGSWRWFDAHATNRLSDPAIAGIVVTYLDVTGLQRMESERQVISEIVHALNQTANLDELLNGIHQALKKVLYAENCFVALHDSAEDSFYFPFFADEFDSAPPPQKVDRSCTAYVFRTEHASIISQTEF